MNDDRFPALWVIVSAVALSLLVVMWWGARALPVVLVIACVTGGFLATTRRRSSPVSRAVVAAACELAEVVKEYEDFCSSATADAYADRTIHRPALMDQKVPDRDIQDFFFQFQSTQRFLARLPARMEVCGSQEELNSLLTVVEERTQELMAAWRRAYRRAAELGTDYPVALAPTSPPPSGSDSVSAQSAGDIPGQATTDDADEAPSTSEAGGNGDANAPRADNPDVSDEPTAEN